MKAVMICRVMLSILFIVSFSIVTEASAMENADLQQKLSCRMTKPILETVQQAETAGKLSPELLLMKARALKVSGRHEEAIVVYSDYLRQDPGNLTANYELGTCYAELRKTAELDSLIAVMAPKWSSSLELLLLRVEARYKPSETAENSELAKQIEKYRPATEEEYILKARWLLSTGKTDEAVDSFRAAKKLWPRSVFAYLSEAMIQAEQKKFRQSQDVVDQTLVIYNSCGAAYFIRGMNQAAASNLSEALASFEKSVSLGVESGLLFEKRGDLYFKQFKFQEAIDDYTVAISKLPRHYRLYLMRAQAHFARQEQRKAYDDVCRASDIAQDKCVECYYWRGRIAEMLGIRKDALAAYEKFLQLIPEDDVRRANIVAALARLSY